jgi:hypothetical protein
MIVTEFYSGQGLGNQLWCYFTTRLIAHRKNYQYGIKSPELFKGRGFLNIDMGQIVLGGDGKEGGPPTTLPNGIVAYYKERETKHPNGAYISKADDLLLNIGDRTKLDGNMQSIKYVEGAKNLIKTWVNVKAPYEKSIEVKPEICAVHVRGGDFKGSKSLLNRDYYLNAMNVIRTTANATTFVAITDDVEYFKSLNLEIPLVGSALSLQDDQTKAGHHRGGPVWVDWLILQKASYVILCGSSFSFWPTYLSDAKVVVAPKYWGDYIGSDGYWSCGDMVVNGWLYLDRYGKVALGDQLLEEKASYERTNSRLWDFEKEKQNSARLAPLLLISM